MAEESKKSLDELISERDTTGIATSVIYWGDNLKVLAKLPQNSVDLIYLDPPFSPDKKYWLIWDDEDEALKRAYDEACSGGRHTYVAWMRDRVELMHRALKEDGSFYFHCDPHLGHYFKTMLDGVFEERNFKREIVWRVGWVSGFKSRAKNWIRNHETIFFYTKSKKFKFNKPYIPHPEEYKRRGGKENPEGVPIDDVWTDIYSIQHLSFSKEKTGYYSQKSEALLERIIKASSNPNDIVLDPFCGCGTTPVVAYKLDRRWIGIDLAEKGFRTTSRRLEDLRAPYYVVPWDLEEKQIQELGTLSGNEFQNWVLLRIGGIKRRGIDGGIDLYTSKLEPVQAKKPKVSPGDLRDFRTSLQNERKSRGYIVSYNGFSRGAIEEANKYRAAGIEIKLVGVRELDEHF